MSKENLKNNGITLIALIITIIIMLILTGVTLSITLGDNGIVNKAKEAVTQTQLEMDRELLLSAVIGAIGEDGTFVKSNIVLPEGFTLNGDIYTSAKGNRFTINEKGEITVAGNVGGDITGDGNGEVVTNPWIERGLSADWAYGKWYVTLYYPEEQWVFLSEDGSYKQSNGNIVFTSEEVDGYINAGILVMNENEFIANGQWKLVLMDDGSCKRINLGGLGSDDIDLCGIEEYSEYNLDGTYLSESGNERIKFNLGVPDCDHYYKSGDNYIVDSVWHYVKYKGTYYFNGEIAEVSEDLNTITYNGTTYIKQAN